MEDQFDNSSLNASQDYLQHHVPAKNGNWINQITSAFKNVDLKKLPNSIGQYGNSAATQIKNMSTAQKVVGGALIAAGAYYLANRTVLNSKIQAALNRNKTVNT